MTPNWKNKTIFTGDNLYVMRGMNAGCVDLVYLDPPFNSNKAYAAPIGSRAAGAAFKDSWTLSDVDLVEHNRLKDENVGLYALMASSRYAHSRGMFSYLVMMAVRLLEMKRILKPTGSIYLHCDPTAGHYLKVVMDAIFGAENFRNEVVWERTTGRSDAKRFARVHDGILYYSMSKEFIWNGAWQPLGERQIRRDYRHEDARGRYQSDQLTAKGLSGGGYDYDFHGHRGPWRYPESRMRELEKEGRIHFPKKPGGMPRYKRYLHESRGIAARDVITDIYPAPRSERTGYPTQKPLALLRRIIEASSSEDDVVFDPFCGCATTLVAADELRRGWVGIDISARAAELVVQRIRDNQGLFRNITARDDIPMRTDQGGELRTAAEMADCKRKLYGLQEGYCNGCQEHFEARHLEMDHVTPRAKGGTSHAANLQLLCGNCNRRKGSRTQAAFKAELANEKGINLSWL